MFQCRRRGKPRKRCSVACDRRAAATRERVRVAALANEKRTARLAQRRRHAAERRARLRAQPIEKFDDREIFERDGYVCGICGGDVDPTLVCPDERRASLDHVVPIARGGAHTRENSQCSHLICNIRRGARVLVAV